MTRRRRGRGCARRARGGAAAEDGAQESDGDSIEVAQRDAGGVGAGAGEGAGAASGAGAAAGGAGAGAGAHDGAACRLSVECFVNGSRFEILWLHLAAAAI